MKTWAGGASWVSSQAPHEEGRDRGAASDQQGLLTHTCANAQSAMPVSHLPLLACCKDTALLPVSYVCGHLQCVMCAQWACHSRLTGMPSKTVCYRISSVQTQVHTTVCAATRRDDFHVHYVQGKNVGSGSFGEVFLGINLHDVSGERCARASHTLK